MFSEEDLQNINEDIVLTKLADSYKISIYKNDIYFIIRGAVFPRSVFLFWFTVLNLHYGSVVVSKVQKELLKQQLIDLYKELKMDCLVISKLESLEKPFHISNMSINALSLLTPKEESLYTFYINTVVDGICNKHIEYIDYFNSTERPKAECALYFIEKECEELIKKQNESS